MGHAVVESKRLDGLGGLATANNGDRASIGTLG
jgi:hypothetical protein